MNIEDLIKDTNSVISRKVVCFEKIDSQYFVYLIVFGFDVIAEDHSGIHFQDKLPLYIIPESKFEEHFKLFSDMFYRVEVLKK